MRILSACLFAVLLVAPGCASGRNYAVNRGADLVDILRLHVMAGPGIGVKAEATRLIHAGILFEQSCFAWGLHNRAVSPWKESVFSWGLVVGYHDETVERIPVLSGDYGWRFDNEGEGGVFQAADPSGNLTLDLLTFRGAVMLLVGIDLEVRVGEVLDFVAGIFQFDPSGDDVDVEAMREPDLPPPDVGAPRRTSRSSQPNDGDYDYTIN